MFFYKKNLRLTITELCLHGQAMMPERGEIMSQKQKGFSWGRVLGTFFFDFDGELMSVVKYHPYIYEDHVSTGSVDTTMVRYHCDEISRSSSSLKLLVIHWMAQHTVGLNSAGLAEGIGRALNLVED